MKRRSNSWEWYAWRQRWKSLDEKSNEKFEINCMLLSCHVRVSEWIHTECQELLAQSRRHIWSLRDSNGIRTCNHWLRKRRFKHLLLKRCQKKSKWKAFPEKLQWDNKINLSDHEYSKRLSRGGLTALLPALAAITCDCFSIKIL